MPQSMKTAPHAGDVQPPAQYLEITKQVPRAQLAAIMRRKRPVELVLGQIPNPALWGVVAGILRIVPNVGTLFAATLPIALSLAVFDGWFRPLLVFLLVAGLELIIANFIEPWLYGSQVGISSLALLVTTVFWTVLWGPAGLILSTPLTVCVVVLGRYVPQLSFLQILLGDEPVLAAEAQIYQRLLAMDQLEAQGIVSQFL